MILLGVVEHEEGRLDLVGIERADQVIGDLWSQLNNPQKVSVNLLDDALVRKHQVAGGRWVIEVAVPRASRKQHPVFINGNPLTGTYKRLSAGDYRCREDEVRRMMAEQTEDERDARLLEHYDFADIEPDSFKGYRQRLAALKPDHPYNGSGDTDFLRQIGGWRRDRETGKAGLTLAGLLMFGKLTSIQEAVAHYFVDYRELPTNDSRTKWVDRLTPDGTWPGNLYELYRLTIQRLFRDLRMPFRLEGSQREDDTPVHKALREALVNAIVHADYSVRASLQVMKAPDYFEFRNPGRMRIPIDEALRGGHSDCRNRSLQRMFSLIGLGEQAGSGIPRVLENWKSQHYRAPELEESMEPEETTIRLRTVSLLPEETLTELRMRLGEAFEGLDEHSRVALATAEIEGFVTNGRLRRITGTHPRDITVLLGKLVGADMLVRDGRGRATSYRLAGVPVVDLATPGSVVRISGGPAPGTENLNTSSEPLVTRSTHKEIGSPTHKTPSPTHKAPNPTHKAPSPTHKAPSPTHKAPSNEHRMSVGSVHSQMRPAGMPLSMALPGAPAAPPPHRALPPPPTPPSLALSHSPAPVPGPSAPRTPLRGVLHPSQPESRPACTAIGRMCSAPIRSPRRACLGAGRSVRIARPASATARRCAAPDLSYRLSASSVRSPPCRGQRRVNQTGLPIRTTAFFGRLPPSVLVSPWSPVTALNHADRTRLCVRGGERSGFDSRFFAKWTDAT